MDQGQQRSVFLCHSSADKPFVRRLARHLLRYGFNVWLDEFELAIGDSIIERLAVAIDTVTYVLAVISTHSAESNWVKKELSLAMTRETVDARVVVLPVVIDDCELPAQLRDKLYADFRKGKGSLVQFLQLLKSMGALTDFEPPLTGAQLDIVDFWADLELNELVDSAINQVHFLRTSSVPLFMSHAVRSRGTDPLLGGYVRRIKEKVARPRVFIMWHDEGFLLQDALSLVASLADIAVEGVVAKHWNPQAPNALFIARDAEPRIVTHILNVLTYQPTFIFPTNYLDPECGAVSGCAMSIGLDSRTRQESPLAAQQPFALTTEVLAQLRNKELSAAELKSILDKYVA